MLKNKINALLLASVMAMFAACSDEDPKPEPPIVGPIPPLDTIVPPPVDTIFPVDFNFISLNKTGNSGDGVSSISYIKKDGTILLDYFKETNGEQIADRLNSATQIEDKLYIVQNNHWTSNNIQVLDPNTLKRLTKFEFNKDLKPYDLEHLGGDSVVVVGLEFNKEINLLIGNLKAEEFIQRSFNTDFFLSRALKIGNKLIVGGPTYQKDGQFFDSKLAIFDINNISNDGMRIIHDQMNLFNSNADFLVDKNGKIWFIANKENTLICFCLDPETEKIVKAVSLPTSISPHNELSYTLDNTGSTLYIRSHKAFFTIDIDNPTTPDDPVYEYRTTVAQLSDLKITKEGTLLVINEIKSSQFKGSKILEFKPSTTAAWTITKEYELPHTIASSIYVAKYEK